MDKKEVEKIALLARLRIPEEEKEVITKQILNILSLVDTLKEADTDEVEPLQSMRSMTLFPDKVKKFDNISGILNNAPALENNLFKVKKVL